MNTSDTLEFINRDAELAFLTKCLHRQPRSPALIIIRSPAGFGKSRLTSQLKARCSALKLKFCIVDPSIRTRMGTARLYDGFFLQRCATELSAMSESGEANWPKLSTFLKDRRWKTALEKKKMDSVSELPSFSHVYRLAFDYASRLLGFGRFSPSQLLSSDQSDAVRICSEYVETILAGYQTVLIVREAQHCDTESLRTLLRLNQFEQNVDLLFEYTSEGEFDSEHQKQFLRTAESHEHFHILDLVRLEPKHLEFLIRQNVKADFALTSDFYLSWNGNLRSVVELKFRVGIGQKITEPAQISSVLGNLTKTLQDHITELPSIQRLILVICLVHVEAIDRWTLMHGVVAVEARTRPYILAQALVELVEIHGFLTQTENFFRIQNDSVATSLMEMLALRPFIIIAEKVLRDHYMKLINTATYDRVGLVVAARQAFRLCARTKDATGLICATEALTFEVRRCRDQSVYVDIVASAIEADPYLYANDHDELVVWAASLAYDTCDWERTEKLLSIRTSQDNFCLTMRACALQEIGRHDEALTLISEVRRCSAHSDDRLVANLIETLIIGCQGQHEVARLKLEELINDPDNGHSPLLGYAYRFFEVVSGFDECFDRLLESVSWFDKFGFSKSKAYSQLPAAVLMARIGNIEGARTMIGHAQVTLENEVRDQHIILNNQAAIELLGENPDFGICKEMLLKALTYTRDDFSELTVLTNLSLAYWGDEELEAAMDCVEKTLIILRDHDFADKDIYWPVCFNAGQVMLAAGFIDRRTEVLQFLSSNGQSLALNENYWAYRFGDVNHLDERYRFLAGRPWHPLYLSHWLIDLEGLNLLKRARLQ